MRDDMPASGADGEPLDEGSLKWGFDLTDFGDNWPMFVKEIGLGTATRIKGAFEWRNDLGLRVVTQNNPETGEYGPGRDKREDAPGFASYMGAEGTPAEIERFAGLVRKYATFIKDESPGQRDFI
jgi:hypothetical protein